MADARCLSLFPRRSPRCAGQRATARRHRHIVVAATSLAPIRNAGPTTMKTTYGSRPRQRPATGPASAAGQAEDQAEAGQDAAARIATHGDPSAAAGERRARGRGSSSEADEHQRPHARGGERGAARDRRYAAAVRQRSAPRASGATMIIQPDEVHDRRVQPRARRRPRPRAKAPAAGSIIVYDDARASATVCAQERRRAP